MLLNRPLHPTKLTFLDLCWKEQSMTSKGIDQKSFMSLNIPAKCGRVRTLTAHSTHKKRTTCRYLNLPFLVYMINLYLCTLHTNTHTHIYIYIYIYIYSQTDQVVYLCTTISFLSTSCLGWRGSSVDGARDSW